MKARCLRISVGPAPSHWGTSRLKSFYRQVARGPADYVYLGETVCPRRSRLTPDLAGSLHEELSGAGKEVYASSLILTRTEAQCRHFDDLARQIGRIEINGPAFLDLMRRYPAVGGMSLNVCNSTTARLFARRGARRIVLPCELGLRSIRCIAGRSPVAVEVVVHGHLPVAMSGTCYTARCFGQAADGCGESCGRYPVGMVLEAGGRPIFRIDGPQTLSAGSHCLIEHLTALAAAGVHSVRILPQVDHTDRIVRIYRDVLDGRRDCRDALSELRALSSGPLCNGWFLGKAGWEYESPN